MSRLFDKKLEYPVQFKLNQTFIQPTLKNQNQNNCFYEYDSFNQNHCNLKKNNENVRCKNEYQVAFKNQQKYLDKVDSTKQNFYVSYKISQNFRNVPEFQFKCKAQSKQSNRTSPNFKQSLIKIEQNQSPLKVQKLAQKSEKKQKILQSYQNQQSINPFKKSSQFKNKRIDQSKQLSSINYQNSFNQSGQNLYKYQKEGVNKIEAKKLFFENEDTLQEFLKRQKNSNYNIQNNQQSLIFDDFQSQNVFTPYKANPLRNDYLANRSISSLQKQFQRDLDKFSSFNSKNQNKYFNYAQVKTQRIDKTQIKKDNQDINKSIQYKPFRLITEQLVKFQNLEFLEKIQSQQKKNCYKDMLLNSQSSLQDKDNIFFLTNVHSNKKSKRTYTQPIQQFHFNLSNIINLDNSTYLNQNCSSQIKENQQSSSKLKLKNLIYGFVDQLDCLSDYEVSNELIQDLESVMKQIISQEQIQKKKCDKAKFNTEESTSSDFKIFRNSIIKDKTNKLNQEKSKQKKMYMKGTISSSAKSLQQKQLNKSRNKENIKDTRIRGKNEVYLKNCDLDTNRTKKSMTSRKLF